jgi:tetratricopeptide (TPR) repeat protein
VHSVVLTQVAGWLSIDASRHVEANKYLTTALYTAYETDDDTLAAHVLGYMSLHALYRDRTREAASLARTSLDRAQASRIPALHAILSMRLARSHARLGETDLCRRALDMAAQNSGQEDAGQPLWLRYVDTVELAAQRGACLLDLGHAAEAVKSIEEAILLLQSNAPNRSRDLAHYKVRLASAHVMQGDLERAVSVAGEAYLLTTEIDSARINERFADLIHDLSKFDSTIVRETLDSLGLRSS